MYQHHQYASSAPQAIFNSMANNFQDPESDNQARSPTFVSDFLPSQTALQAPESMLPAKQRRRHPAHKVETSSRIIPYTAPTPSKQAHHTKNASRTATLPAHQKKMHNSSTFSDISTSSSHTTPAGHTAAKRLAHNIIEKRYRNNMNAKFMALEKAILQHTPAQGGRTVSDDGGSVVLKKSKILSNAIACINDLHDENAALWKQLDLLRQNL